MRDFSPFVNPLRPVSARLAPDSASVGSGELPPLPPPPPTPPSDLLAGSSPEPKAESNGNGGGMLNSLRVSLMPSDLEGRPAPNLARSLLLFGIVLAAETVLIGILYFVVSRTVSSRLAERDGLVLQVQQAEAAVKAIETDATPAAMYYYQLDNARTVLDSHVYWTAFLAFIEKNTLNSIQFRNFAGDAYSGTVSVDAIGLSYRDVAEQIISLRENPLVEEVRSTSASADVSELGTVNGVSFSMLIRIKPEAWLKIVAANPNPTPTPTPVPTPTTPEPVETPISTPPPEDSTETPVIPPPTDPVTPTEPTAPPETSPEVPVTPADSAPAAP